MPEPQSLPILLKELRLTTISKHFQPLEKQAQEQSWSYSGYLSELCHRETQQRHDNRLKRLLKDSCLPTGKLLSHFEFNHVTGIQAKQIQHLMDERDWLRLGHNVLIFGASGLGKTHLASALGYGLVSHGIRVKFTAATVLTQQLLKAREQLQLNSLLKKLDKYELLIVDDIGYVKPTNAEGQVLFELIAHRYERFSLLITSNQDFSHWDQIFGDNMMTVAAIDRLVHKAKIIHIEGESYRKKYALNTK